jgi:hypothetical protein
MEPVHLDSQEHEIRADREKPQDTPGYSDFCCEPEENAYRQRCKGNDCQQVGCHSPITMRADESNYFAEDDQAEDYYACPPARLGKC